MDFKRFDGGKLGFVFNLMRPPVLLAFFGVMLLGTHSVKGFDFGVLPGIVFYSVSLFFIAFSLNDLFDRDIDKSLGRKGGIKGEIVREDWQKKFIVYGNLVVGSLVLISLPFLNWLSRFSVISLLLLSFAYSVPPMRLKSVPVLDAVSNGLAIFLYFSLGAGLMGASFSEIIPLAYWGALIFMPIDALGSCTDIEADRSQGVKTSATLLGWKGSSIWLISTVIASLIFVNWDLIAVVLHLIGIITGLTLFVTESSENFYKLVKIDLIIGLALGLTWLAIETGII